MRPVPGMVLTASRERLRKRVPANVECPGAVHANQRRAWYSRCLGSRRGADEPHERGCLAHALVASRLSPWSTRVRATTSGYAEVRGRLAAARWTRARWWTPGCG